MSARDALYAITFTALCDVLCNMSSVSNSMHDDGQLVGCVTTHGSLPLKLSEICGLL